VSLPIYTSTIRQLFSQPVRCGALLGAALLPLLQTSFDPDPRLGNTTWAMWIAVIAASGIIGLEVSSGSLSLFFTRPLSRARYVLSRWSAAASVALTAISLGLAIETTIIAIRNGDISAAAVALALTDRALLAIGIVSVLACFSAIASSLGDLVIWASLHILGVALGAAGHSANIVWLQDVARLLRRVANPMLDVHRLLASSRVPWAEVTGYAATLALAAAIAIFVMNRKELSYASE
jgi:hypothetical protein